MPLVEIKDFTALIENNPFFFWSSSKKQTRRGWKTYRNVKKLWLYNKKLISLFVSWKYYKFIGTNLSRSKNTSSCQEISFIGKLEEDNGAKMFFIAEKQQKNGFQILFLDSLIVTE